MADQEELKEVILQEQDVEVSVATDMPDVVVVESTDMSPPKVEAFVTLCCDDPDVVVAPQFMPSQLQAALVSSGV